jgi:hypothetical protein
MLGRLATAGGNCLTGAERLQSASKSMPRLDPVCVCVYRSDFQFFFFFLNKKRRKKKEFLKRVIEILFAPTPLQFLKNSQKIKNKKKHQNFSKKFIFLIDAPQLLWNAKQRNYYYRLVLQKMNLVYFHFISGVEWSGMGWNYIYI